MKLWVRYRRGRARYSGRVSRAPFDAWLATAKGQHALDEATSRTRFRLFARARAARRLWRQLAAAAREPDAVVIIQSELDAYLGRLEEFAYADGLPRRSVHLHRLVEVPRVLITSAAYRAIARRLHSADAFAALEGGDSLRDVFITTLIGHLDGAIAGAAPSAKRPLQAGKDWITVGLENAFVWRLRGA